MAAPILTNPQVLASGIGALGSLGSSFLGGLLNQKNMDSQVQRSKELMKYQWDNFQSPKAQVSALASAGINPAVALGQGGSGFTATPSPSMPTSQPIPVPEIGDIGQFVLAMATAKKAGLESVAQKLENDYNTRTMEERVRAVGLENKWKEEDTTRLIQQWTKTVAETNVLAKDAEIKSIDLDKHKELVNAIINHYVSQSNLSNANADSIRQQLPIVLQKLQAESDVLSVDADIAKDYKETMTQVGVVGDVIKILGRLAKILGK